MVTRKKKPNKPNAAGPGVRTRSFINRMRKMPNNNYRVPGLMPWRAQEIKIITIIITGTGYNRGYCFYVRRIIFFRRIHLHKIISRVEGNA